MLEGSAATFDGAIAWLLACLVVWWGLRRWVGPFAQAHPRLAIAAVAVVARAGPTLALDRGLFFDVEAHWWVGSLTLAGQDIYTAPWALGRYPYPPLHMYMSALLVWLSGGDRAAFLVADKLIPAACGVGVALAIRATALRLGGDAGRALLLGLLYAANPLPILVTSYHGQYEEIPLLCIALAFLLLAGPRQSAGATVLSAVVLGLAVAYKTWPLLFLPPLVLAVRGSGRRLLYLPLTLAPLAISIGLFGLGFGRAGMQQAVRRMIEYKGSDGFCWGYASLLHPCWVHPASQRPNAWVLVLDGKLLLAAMLLVGLLVLWRRRPLEGLVAFPLAFYLFSPGWGPNYSVWVLPFLLLLSARLATGYTLVLLPLVSLTYVDSLYVAYRYYAFSWATLKPLEAVLGFAAWIGVAAILTCVHGAPWGFSIARRGLGRSRERRRGVGWSVAALVGVLVVTLAAAAVDLSGAPSFVLRVWRPITLRPGRDLGSGMRLLLQVRPRPGQAVDQRTVTMVQHLIAQRLAGLGISDTVVGTVARGRSPVIGVELPQALELMPDVEHILGQTGRFTLVALNGALLPRGAWARAYRVLARGTDVIPRTVSLGLGPVTAGPAVDAALRAPAAAAVDA